MRRIIFTLAVMLGLAISANAQEVGNLWVGGSVGFSVTDDGYDNYTNYNFVPEVGFVLSDKLGIGVKLGYQHLELGSTTLLDQVILVDEGKLNVYSINPFLRMACLKGDLGGLFVDGGAGYSYAKISHQNLHLVEVGFRPGVSLNVSNRAALTGKFGFLGWQHANGGGGSAANAYGFDFNLNQIQIGMNLVF